MAGHWLPDNWVEILNVVGIVGGLCFTAHSLRSETKTRRIANQLALTEGHRDIWRQLFEHPELARVLNPEIAITPQTVTPQEEIFVGLVIQHLSVVFHAMRDELTINPEGLRRDVFRFFSLPIPHAVWENVKVMQNEKFVAFVESCRNWK